MKRFSILGLTAVVALAGTLVTVAPAQAKVFFSFGVGHGYGYGFRHNHYYRPYYYAPHYCGLRSVRVKIRRHHHWQWVRSVRRVCY